ncbi:Krueppel-like factor 13 [Globicephala melas]|uniref:Krueppel-like factor 13 n=1 Tax=Globicephala melas TaxID=9731 RepID=UPI00293D6622|nr:Krueppel-like factor 13 [Globicephala melas]
MLSRFQGGQEGKDRAFHFPGAGVPAYFNRRAQVRAPAERSVGSSSGTPALPPRPPNTPQPASRRRRRRRGATPPPPLEQQARTPAQLKPKPEQDARQQRAQPPTRGRKGPEPEEEAQVPLRRLRESFGAGNSHRHTAVRWRLAARLAEVRIPRLRRAGAAPPHCARARSCEAHLWEARRAQPRTSRGSSRAAARLSALAGPAPSLSLFDYSRSDLSSTTVSAPSSPRAPPAWAARPLGPIFCGSATSVSLFCELRAPRPSSRGPEA